MPQYGTAIYLGNTLIEKSFLGNNQALPFFGQQTISYVTSGSVMILDGGATASYSGTGNTWFDISGYGNNAALTNMAAYYTASGGGYFTFPGNTNNFMTVAQSGSLNIGTADFTIDIWVTVDSFVTSGPNDLATPFAKPSYATNPGFGGLFVRNSNDANFKKYFWYENNSATGTSALTLSAGSWWNLQIVRSGTSLTIYQNTNSVSSTTNSLNFSNTRNLIIGKDLDATLGLDTNAWFGKVGWFGIYNRALSTGELQQNYNSIKTRYGL